MKRLLMGMFLCASVVGAGEREAVLGFWLTPPDAKNGAAIVEIRQKGEALSGRLVWLEKPLYPPGDPAAGKPKVDRENPDPNLRTRPVLGLEILTGFRWDGKRWVDGEIYDPVTGNTYRATITLEGQDRLRLRGYVGIPLLGRTEVWTRVPGVPENQTAPGSSP